jgi:hypothetical protein
MTLRLELWRPQAGGDVLHFVLHFSSASQDESMGLACMENLEGGKPRKNGGFN